jgi:L-proline amide hydrolase
MELFYARHVCRVQPLPPDVRASCDQLAQDPTVYHTMNGPSEFHVIGSLKDWSIVDRLDRITVPTLVVAGAHDEAMPATWAPFVDRIDGARSHVFPESSHMPHVEEPEAFLSVVGAFLREHDRPAP